MTQQQWNEKVTNTLAALKFVSGPIFQNTETSEPYISSSGLSFENSNTKSIPIHFVAAPFELLKLEKPSNQEKSGIVVFNVWRVSSDSEIQTHKTSIYTPYCWGY